MSMEMEIIEQLKEEFIVPENVPENITKRDEYLKIAKASFVIRANTLHLIPFLGSSYSSNGNQGFCRLLGSETMDFPYEYQLNEYKIQVNAFEVNVSARFHEQIFLPSNVQVQCKNGNSFVTDSCFQYSPACKAIVEQWSKNPEQKIFSYYGSLYGFCKKITRKAGTPDEVLRHFGVDNPLPFANGKGSSAIRQGNFYVKESPSEKLENLKTASPGLTEEALVNSIFQEAMQKSLFYFELSTEYFKTYQNWYKQIFEFKNHYGETTMLGVKIYDFNLSIPRMLFP